MYRQKKKSTKDKIYIVVVTVLAVVIFALASKIVYDFAKNNPQAQAPIQHQQ